MGHDESGRQAKKPLNGAALVMRADASTQIGSGHVMRCLALAQAWQDDGGQVTFLSALPEAVRTRLEAAGMPVRPVMAIPGTQGDAHQVIALARELGTPYVVVDGYHFGADYQQWIKTSGLRLLFLDDNGHAEHYYADLVLNQNIHATEKLYPSREPKTRLLLGTRYALLRREFWPWRDRQREIPHVARKVLVTLGGSDPDNVTLKVLRALERVEVEHLEVKIIVGGSNPHREVLQTAVSPSVHRIQLEQDVSDMPALMAWADVAVSAGGSTCWELAFMGLPGVILVLADNQLAAANGLGERGIAMNLGWHMNLSSEIIAKSLAELLESEDSRTQMSLRGRELVDSRGGERVIQALDQVL